MKYYEQLVNYELQQNFKAYMNSRIFVRVQVVQLYISIYRVIAWKNYRIILIWTNHLITTYHWKQIQLKPKNLMIDIF